MASVPTTLLLDYYCIQVSHIKQLSGRRPTFASINTHVHQHWQLFMSLRCPPKVRLGSRGDQRRTDDGDTDTGRTRCGGGDLNTTWTTAPTFSELQHIQDSARIMSNIRPTLHQIWLNNTNPPNVTTETQSHWNRGQVKGHGITLTTHIYIWYNRKIWAPIYTNLSSYLYVCQTAAFANRFRFTCLIWAAVRGSFVADIKFHICSSTINTSDAEMKNNPARVKSE